MCSISGKLAVLFRRCNAGLQNTLQISLPVSCTQRFISQLKTPFQNITTGVSCNSNILISARTIHISSRSGGLDEFFESPKNIGEKQIKSAAPWSRDLLRLKSNEDLHKLWFILLKERNMLETMQYYYESEDEPMPSPERLEKVAESMSNLRDVLEEREKAQNMLLYGRTKKTGGEYRKSGLGAVYWYDYQQYLFPKHLQKNLYGDRPADIADFHPHLQEWHIRFHERRSKLRIGRAKALRMKWGKIRKRNPQLSKSPPEWWLKKLKTKYRYGIHPETPVLL